MRMIDNWRIQRNSIELTLASCLLFMNLAVLAGGTRVALLGSDSRFGKAKDLMSAELSKNDAVLLLSRNEWSRLLREYERVKTNSALRSGSQFSAADALIIFRQFEFKNRKFTICKLVDVKHAVVVDSIAIPAENAEFKWIGGMAKRFTKTPAKLANGGYDHLKKVSVLNFRSDSFSPAALELERQLKAAVGARLDANDKILLTERENAPEVLFEHSLTNAKDIGFATADSLIDGGFTLNGDKITLRLRTREKGGKAKIEILTGSATNPAELAKKIAHVAATELGAENIGHDTKWNSKKEATEYTAEAKWAFQNGLFKLSAESAEAAWALGDHSLSNAILRVVAYANSASNGRMLKSSSALFTYSTSEIDKNNIGDRLGDAITAMSLFNKHIFPEIPTSNLRMKTKFYRKHMLGYFQGLDEFKGKLLLAVILPLKAARKLGPEFELSLKARVLRKLVRSAPLNINISPVSSLLSKAVCLDVTYWYDTPEEQSKRYVYLLPGTGYSTRLARRIWKALRKTNKLRYYPPLFHDPSNRKFERIAFRNDFFNKLASSKNRILSFYGNIFLVAAKKPFNSQRLRDVVWKYVDDIANMRPSNQFVFSDVFDSLSESDRCEYALTMIEKRRNRRWFPFFDIEDSLKRIKTFQPKYRNAFKKALAQLTERRHSYNIEKSIVKMIEERLDIREIGIKPTKVLINCEDNPFGVCSLNGRAVFAFWKSSSNAGTTRLVLKSFAGKFEKPAIVLETPSPFAKNYCSHLPVMAITDKYVAFGVQSRLYLYSLEGGRWRKDEFPGGRISGLIFKNDSLWILSSADYDHNLYENAIRELDLKSGSIQLVASSRRIPKENILDGSNLIFRCLLDLGGKCLLLGADEPPSSQWSDLDSFFLINCETKEIEKVTLKNVFKNGKSLFEKCVVWKKHNSTHILFVHRPNENTMMLRVREYGLWQFNLKTKPFTDKYMVYDGRISWIFPENATPVLELSDAATASLCESSIFGIPSSFLVVEKRGVRRIPIILKKYYKSVATNCEPRTLVATSDGFYLLLASNRNRYPAFFSKRDLETARKNFPLYPYAKIVPAKPPGK